MLKNYIKQKYYNTTKLNEKSSNSYCPESIQIGNTSVKIHVAVT